MLKNAELKEKVTKGFYKLTHRSEKVVAQTYNKQLRSWKVDSETSQNSLYYAYLDKKIKTIIKK